MNALKQSNYLTVKEIDCSRKERAVVVKKIADDFSDSVDLDRIRTHSHRTICRGMNFYSITIN